MKWGIQPPTLALPQRGRGFECPLSRWERAGITFAEFSPLTETQSLMITARLTFGKIYSDFDSPAAGVPRAPQTPKLLGPSFTQSG